MTAAIAPLSVVPDHDELSTVANTWPERAKALKVVNDSTFAEAAHMLTGIKALRREAADVFDGPIKAAHQAHKEALAAKKKVEAPLAEAETILKGSIGAYQLEQERKQREEQERLEAEARAREEDARLAEAAELENAGHVEEAEQLIETPVQTPVILAPRPVPKVQGVAIRETFRAKVEDKRAALAFILENFQFLGHLVDINQGALNRMVQQQKGTFRIPGVRTYTEKTVAAGAR